MKELEVLFNSKKVKTDQIMKLSDVQVKPFVKFNIPSGKYYTIIMVDPDAPSREKPIYKHWLHWLIINNDETVIDFEPSKPPKNSGLHRYYICLYEQKSKIKVTLDKNKRQNFSVQDFIKGHDLTFIAGTMYKTELK